VKCFHASPPRRADFSGGLLFVGAGIGIGLLYRIRGKNPICKTRKSWYNNRRKRGYYTGLKCRAIFPPVAETRMAVP
jgi:hypothetical protein